MARVSRALFRGSRVPASVFLVLVGCLVSAGPLRAQDPHEVAGMLGRTLPPGYYDQLLLNPEFFRTADGWRARTIHAVESSTPLGGRLPVAVILALFADSREPAVSHEDIQAALFDGPTPYGTVSGYYTEVSGGRFTVEGEAFPWVRTSLTMAQVVGDSYGLGGSARTGEYLFEAAALADELVDFGQFDNDGPDGIPNSGDDDGSVDAVAFQFQEVAASCGGPSIWPHRSRLEYWNDGTPFITNDLRPDGTHIVLNDYITQGAFDCGGTEVQKATTIAHELGHVLGLPDLYDRSQGLEPQFRRWVVGCWSLMAAGSWGCGTEDRESWVRPTHLGAWEKTLLGWAQVQEVGRVLDEEFTLEPVLEGGRILKVPLEWEDPDFAWQEEDDEYLLIEYRIKEGFDQDLPASGVLVYHIDPKISGNRPCDTCPQIYRVALVEADGNASLRRSFLQGGNRGEPGDAWGALASGRLTNNTTPSSRLNSGERSPVSIYRIFLDAGLARITLSSKGLRTETLVQRFLETDDTPLTAEERSYLDAHGNGNGEYDVGDLRAHLRR